MSTTRSHSQAKIGQRFDLTICQNCIRRSTGKKMELPEVQVGDTVRLRKTHPCGGDTWQVTRLGTDIGLRCLTCGRIILLRRALFRRRLKAILPRQVPLDTERSSG